MAGRSGAGRGAAALAASAERRRNRRRHGRSFGQSGDAVSPAEAISGRGAGFGPGGGKVGRRLGVDPFDPELKSIVDQNIATFYATAEKLSLTQLRKRIATDCRPRLLKPPSIRRLKAYLGTLDAEALTRKREGKARADARFLALPVGLSVERAMEIVQIDHTKVDVTVVDPIERLSIGRPILTVAMTFSPAWCSVSIYRSRRRP